MRERFGLTFDAAEQRTFDRSVRVLRATLPRLPARLRYVPPYFEARRRIAGSERVGLGRARRDAGLSRRPVKRTPGAGDEHRVTGVVGVAKNREAQGVGEHHLAEARAVAEQPLA